MRVLISKPAYVSRLLGCTASALPWRLGARSVFSAAAQVPGQEPTLREFTPSIAVPLVLCCGAFVRDTCCESQLARSKKQVQASALLHAGWLQVT